MAHVAGGGGTRYLSPDLCARPNFAECVAMGLVRNWSLLHVYARNGSIAATQEDLWEVGGVMVYPAAAATISIVSDSADDDDDAGTGMRSLEVEGLDANCHVISETVLLAGLTPVVTVNEYFRVNGVEGLTVGSGEYNVGTISGTLSGNPIFQVSPLDGVSHASHYTVPADHRAYPIELSAWQGKDNQSNVGILHRTAGVPWHRLTDMILYRGQTHVDFHLTEAMSEKTDVKLVAAGASGAAVDQAAYYAMLVEKYQ